VPDGFEDASRRWVPGAVTPECIAWWKFEMWTRACSGTWRLWTRAGWTVPPSVVHGSADNQFGCSHEVIRVITSSPQKPDRKRTDQWRTSA
jgi:hypothetical protein